ncbi:fliH protein [Azospirillum sp.]|uniref:fliH protein n=1 Tax=Azospirillum sp. TaxID=34012 RepID=UPI002D30A5F3|nr:fliH protein [Azospirillum sp.]HYD66908.1 fliH protein [Azospirillum sp.]
MGYPRYRFDLRFDSTAQAAAEAAKVENPEPAVDPLDLPQHSERALRAALAAAETRGYADGVEQGRREGEAEATERIEAALAHALRCLDERLGTLDDRHAEVLRGVEAHGAALMVALVRRIAPRLIEHAGRAEVERLAAEALRAAGKAPVLRLRVHPELEDAVRAKLDGFAGALEIDTDPAMPPGALDAAWEAGALRNDPEHLERTVAALCDRALAALRSPSPLRGEGLG